MHIFYHLDLFIILQIEILFPASQVVRIFGMLSIRLDKDAIWNKYWPILYTQQKQKLFSKWYYLELFSKFICDLLN